jgi:uncharacterized membrane protein
MIAPELLPNLHPFVAHFPIALLIVSTVCFFVARGYALRPWAQSLLCAARWNLYLAVALGLFAIVTGWLAFADTRPDAAALATTIWHRRTGGLACGLALIAAIAVWRAPQRVPGWFVLAGLLLASTSIGLSAIYGTQLTYRHGLGIERRQEQPRMPVAENEEARSGRAS